MGAPTWLNMDDVPDMREVDNVDSLVPDSIQSQYAASGRIVALARGFQARIDASPDIDTFFEKWVNLPTCEGCALDNWGRIVAITRVLRGHESVTPGFDDQIVWDDAYFKFLLMYKAMANITAADAGQINRMMSMLFQDVTYVLDMQDMTIRVIFDYYPTDVQITMFLAYGLLNRGGGVGYKWYRIKTDETFGFDDQELLPFNQGIFAPYRLTEGF